MPTIRQTKAFNNLVENGGNVTQAMKDAGYAIATVNNPNNLTESDGYRELLKESGLTEELIAKSLVEDIKAKPQNRVSELRLGAEVLGMKVPEQSGNTYNILNVFNTEQTKRIAQGVLDGDSTIETELD